MTHGLNQHIARTLECLHSERRVVGFYDLREEFGPFIAELDAVSTGDSGVGTERAGEGLS